MGSSGQKAAPKIGQFMTVGEAMDWAIIEARQGLGYVSPNPPVGCVILDRNDKYLASGFHAACGDDHAEIAALKKVEDPKLLEGAHFVVTLEPCAHQGRTPSCAKHLATLSLSQVTFGIVDPNPNVSGRGVEILRASGKRVIQLGSHSEQIEKLTEVFLYNQRFKKAFVSLKVAVSLDGCLAMKSGESQWITGPQAREEAHKLRALHDGILVGRNTVLVDNPRLNVRHPQYPNKSNTVIVLDPKARVLSTLKQRSFYKVNSDRPIIVVVEKDREQVAQNEKRIKTLGVELTKDGFLSLSDLAKKLLKEGICSILVEGGAFTLSEFLRQSEAQRLFQFMAPKIMGGQQGMGWAEHVNVSSIKESYQLNSLECRSVGPDILVTGRFQSFN